jgi:hypothetical protein
MSLYPARIKPHPTLSAVAVSLPRLEPSLLPSGHPTAVVPIAPLVSYHFLTDAMDRDAMHITLDRVESDWQTS